MSAVRETLYYVGLRWLQEQKQKRPFILILNRLLHYACRPQFPRLPASE
jgi:hypothetical protein